MEAGVATVAAAIVAAAVIHWVVRMMNWAWRRPRELENGLREQGYKGNPYRVLLGDLRELHGMIKDTKSKHIHLSDDILPYVLPYNYHIIKKFGKNSFIWFGPSPRLNISDPELVKEILAKPEIFQKPHPEPFRDAILGGLVVAEGQKWEKHRKIINPAFHQQKLKNMIPIIHSSCIDMIGKWEKLVPSSESCEVDVWPYLDDLSGDVISQTAFGSSHEEGKKIFLLQKELVQTAIQLIKFIYIPGWRFLPTKANKRFREIRSELQVLLQDIIRKREKAMETGEGNYEDLLGILLESNTKEIKEHGIGMSMVDVMEECKLFYFAGSETTSNLIAWTMILLSNHPNWQTQAREEVFQLFGTKKPDFDDLNRLKIITMILNEVLRLYPPAAMIIREVTEKTDLGSVTLEPGVQLTLLIMDLHRNREIWGNDASEFNPGRFSEGVHSATKGRFGFLPFSSGPRICIGQNFAMIEAKIALVGILQKFSFELSPSYRHSPFLCFTIPPQFGAQLILHKLC